LAGEFIIISETLRRLSEQLVNFNKFKNESVMETSTLTKELESLPYDLRQEVMDFVAFLKYKQKKQSPLKEREFGFAKDRVKIAVDFDAPLEEFNDYI
jgi:Protein of unknown function (DUF2281)